MNQDIIIILQSIIARMYLQTDYDFTHIIKQINREIIRLENENIPS